jgi:hypothetical protein
MLSDFSNTFTALVGLALASPTRVRQRILCRRSAGSFFQSGMQVAARCESRPGSSPTWEWRAQDEKYLYEHFLSHSSDRKRHRRREPAGWRVEELPFRYSRQFTRRSIGWRDWRPDISSSYGCRIRFSFLRCTNFSDERIRRGLGRRHPHIRGGDAQAIAE